MKLEYLMSFDGHVKEIQKIGKSSQGEKYIYVVTGGTFEGPNLKGHILDGSAADWMTIYDNGLCSLDVRKTFKTHDDALIYVTYHGLYQFDDKLSEKLKSGQGYDFGETLFQVQMQFETGDERYIWLNSTLAVAEARETGKKVEYRAYALN